ncbi:MAG: hypothetical protein ACJAXA_001346 [Candidatus Aldehydirespiratoraceae bacterium]|jgi:hypothetical protein
MELSEIGVFVGVDMVKTKHFAQATTTNGVEPPISMPARPRPTRVTRGCWPTPHAVTPTVSNGSMSATHYSSSCAF